MHRNILVFENKIKYWSFHPCNMNIATWYWDIDDALSYNPCHWFFFYLCFSNLIQLVFYFLLITCFAWFQVSFSLLFVRFGQNRGAEIWGGNLTARSHEVLKLQGSSLDISSHSEIWQAPHQLCCQDACQISEQYDHHNSQSHGFEASWDLVIRHLTT